MQSTQRIDPNSIAEPGLLAGNGPDSRDGANQGHRDGRSSGGNLDGTLALVVEDDPSSARMIAAALSSAGADACVARDAHEALQVLSGLKPQLIVLDLVLPRMSGLMLARQLKADPATRDIVIVAVSGIGGSHTERLAIASGCAAYHTKPIDVDDFLRAVRMKLGEHREQQ